MSKQWSVGRRWWAVGGCLLAVVMIGVGLRIRADTPPPSVDASAASAPWQHVPFAVAQSGSFVAEVDAMPRQAGTDACIGLSYAALDDFNRLTCAVRFSQAGYIEARNGGSYQGPGMRYAPNTAYHFRFVVDVPHGLYSVYVTPAGSTERTIGVNLAFRSGLPPVPNLCYFSIFADIGAMRAWNFSAATLSARAGGGWINRPFAPQTGPFAAEFNVMPRSSGMDAVVGLSNGAQSAFTGFACLVRFTPYGTIEARNGSTYPASSLHYTPGVLYHVRMEVDIPAHRYNIYVTPSGGATQAIGIGYAFRAEQAGVSRLSNVGLIVDSTSGQARLSDFGLCGGLDRFGIRQLYPTVQGGREWTARWDNGIARQWDWGRDPYDPEFHGRGDGLYTIDGRGVMRIAGTAPRLYVYDPWFQDNLAYAPDRFKTWNNVEVTVYFMRVSDQNTSYAGMVAGAKIRHCPDEDTCGDRGYYGKLKIGDGAQVLFEKEINHHTAGGYVQRVSDQHPWSVLPYNRWIGYKYVARDVDNGQHVKLELYIDESGGLNGGSWRKVGETIDAGGWGVDAPPCDPNHDPTEILRGRNLSVFIRNDNVNEWYYKAFSIREIAGQ